MLTDALARVKRERSPQLVTVVGVPGIGKSRLVYELGRSIETHGDLVTWHRGRALPYGGGGHVRAGGRDRQGAGRDPRQRLRRELPTRNSPPPWLRPTHPSANASRTSSGRSSGSASAKWIVGGAPVGGFRRMAPLLRGACRAAAAGARPRGPALGRRWRPRLRRSPRRVGHRRSDPRRVHRQTRALDPPSGLGGREVECNDDLALAALRRAHGEVARRSPPSFGLARRDPDELARGRRRESALRRAVRANTGRERRVDGRAAGDGSGDHRGAHRRAPPGREGLAPGCCRRRRSLLARRRRRGRWCRHLAGRGAIARARAQGVRPP